MCAYGFLVALRVVNAIIERDRLWTTKFRNNATGVEYTAGYKIMLLYFMAHYNWLTFLVIICLVMAVALGLFFAYHMYQVGRGMSTSENAKVSAKLRALGYRMSDLIKRCEERKGDMSAAELEECRAQIKTCERTAVMVLKLYDQRNLWGNLRQILKA